jgi:NAD(P)-dependent dehydrogenase (short-subunit alcohol dehydrogenase family)
MGHSMQGKAVLITGGTKGIGLATGKAFAGEGAQVYLTHKWGSANLDEVQQQFADLGAPAPRILEADVGRDDETVDLLNTIHEQEERLEVFISNVCIVQPAFGIDSYKRRSLLKSLDYSTWPFVSYLKHIRSIFGSYPRYVVGLSSDGPDHYFSNYEFVAASKAAMETFCRYLSKQLAKEDIRLNIVRSRNVLTDAIEEIFGPLYREFLGRYAGEEYFLTPAEIGDAVLALCSGMLDALSGQVIQIDKGMAFADTIMRMLDRREELGLWSPEPLQAAGSTAGNDLEPGKDLS